MSTDTTAPSGPHGREERQRRRRRTTGIVVAAVAALSLVGNAVAVETSLRLYQREQEVRLDPIGLGFHAAERATASASRTKPLLAMFGDSRVAMWTPPTGLPDWEIVNLGVGYQTTAQAILRFDYDVAPFHPTMVVFEIGVNDLKDLSMFPGRRDAIVHTCEENVGQLVTKARALGAEVVLATIFDLGDPAIWRRPIFAAAPTAAAIAEVNVFIRSLARDGVVVFETAPVLDGPNGKVRADYQLDHLHLVAPGYAALNERLVSIVRAFPPGPR